MDVTHKISLSAYASQKIYHPPNFCKLHTYIECVLKSTSNELERNWQNKYFSKALLHTQNVML